MYKGKEGKMNNLEELEKNIGYTFKNKDLLKYINNMKKFNIICFYK